MDRAGASGPLMVTDYILAVVLLAAVAACGVSYAWLAEQDAARALPDKS